MFDLVTVFISKQSFFQYHAWPVYQGKWYLHGIALPDFIIVSPFFYKRSKQARVPTFVWLFRDVATTAKGPGCDEGTNLRWRDFAVVPLMPTRVSYTDVHYIDYPTNTFNALRTCTSLFVDALRISQYFQSCQVFLSSWFEPVPSRG